MKTLIFTFIILISSITTQVQSHELGTISVTGKGEVKVEPDQATITIGVELRDTNLDFLRAQTDSKASAIISVLRNHGIEDKDIQSSYTNLQPHYPYVDSRFPQAVKIDITKPDYYLAYKTITYVLKNLDKYDSVMADLYTIGINRVDGVSFGVENIEMHQQEAKKRAAANAKQIATLITEELGVKLSYAYLMSESTPTEFGYGSRWGAADASAVSGINSSGPSLSDGQIIISSSVSVSFYTLPY